MVYCAGSDPGKSSENVTVAVSEAPTGRPQNGAMHPTKKVSNLQPTRRPGATRCDLACTVLMVDFSFDFEISSSTSQHLRLCQKWMNGSLPCDGALSTKGSGGMQMTDGNGQRIGCVHGLGRLGKLKQPRH